MSDSEGRTVHYGLGFADGEIVGFHKDENQDLLVVFRAWNGVLLEITFEEAIRVLDNNMYSISGLVCLDESAFMQEGLGLMYMQMPSRNPYKHYQFLNQDGDPSLEVVAKAIGITEKA